jgi:hypothetical protein
LITLPAPRIRENKAPTLLKKGVNLGEILQQIKVLRSSQSMKANAVAAVVTGSEVRPITFWVRAADYPL